MLKTWALENFKSISKMQQFEMAPLTLFAGANSSGKSTIIQSILLVAQTLKNQNSSKPVIINGEILNLGSFEDIVFQHEVNYSMSLGFLIDGTGYKKKQLAFQGVPTGTSIRDSVGCGFKFKLVGKGSNRKVVLESCRIKSKYSGSFVENITVRLSAHDLHEKGSLHGFDPSDLGSTEKKSLRYDVEIHEKSSLGLSNLEGKHVGASLYHFLPNKIYSVKSITRKRITYIYLFLTERYSFPKGIIAQYVDDESIDKIARSEELSKVVISCIQPVVSSISKKRPKYANINSAFKELKKNFPLYAVNEFYRVCYVKEQGEIKSAMQNRSPEINKILYELLDDRTAVEQNNIEEVVDLPINFFTTKVKYLGPLREEPRIVYTSSDVSYSKDVGSKGEHTAFILDVHRDTKIIYIKPPSQQEGSVLSGKIVRGTLAQAVLDWLIYLGVATNYSTKDLEKYGQAIQISTDNKADFHDITHVGVGVSQVLPVVVMSLLADKGATLIFEQPELHLHPRVQTRLADFFYSMVLLEKQCVVETHSEYMIDQLRYLSAISTDDKILDNILMYFVEKEHNESVYRQIKINKYGVIEDWPAGFFDENKKKASEILMAGMRKRKREEANDA